MKQWKRIRTISFNCFWRKLSCYKFYKGKEDSQEGWNDSINKIIENACIFTSKEKKTDTFLIHFIYINILWKKEKKKYLRFEDVCNKYKSIIQVYNPQKNKEEEVIISQDLYDQINMKINL